jgi:NADH dehydrogenase
LLASFPERLRRRAERRLKRMGVELFLNRAVAAVQGHELQLGDGTRLWVCTVAWAAGVRAADLAATLAVAQGRNGRVKVTPTLNLPDHPEVFAIGDMAELEGYTNGTAFPMVAPVAIQMGQQAARNILAQAQGEPMRAFRYHNKGQMATIGRQAAVQDAFGIRLDSRLAWLGWLFVHLMQLVGFRNRLIVLANWAYNYVTYERGVQLITGPIERLEQVTREVDGQAEPELIERSVG